MQAYAHLHRVAIPLLFFSLISNLAVLVSPLFMMQVLDRVIPSGNTSTLLLLALIALAALLLQALVEAMRDISLGRVTRWLEGYGTQTAIGADQDDPQSLVERVARFSRFLGGSGAITALSLPWIPVFLAALYLLHPSFVLLLAAMAGIMLSGRSLAHMVIAPEETAAQTLQRQGQSTLENAQSFSELSGVGIIAQNLRDRFFALQTRWHGHLNRRQTALATNASLGNLIRNAGQIGGLGLGAYLVTLDQLSAGAMIAASIILSKTYAAVEGALTQLPEIRNALTDLRLLKATPHKARPMAPAIGTLNGALRAEGLIIPRGGGAPPRLDRVSLNVEAGECLAIIGNSGSGKTSLLHALSGIAPAPIGSVFLDDSEIRGLSAQDLYQSVGYVPQQAGLLPGTLAENIACFEDVIDDQAVISAAKRSGVHGLIAALPTSYATNIATDAHLLSAGQRQRIALARAIYKSPKYLFLDEPNALLDGEGERALSQALARIKQDGTTIIMVLHRSGILGLADKVMKLDKGRIADMGPRNDVLSRLGVGGRQLELPLLESSMDDLRSWIDSQFTRATDDGFSQTAQLVGSEIFRLLQNQGEDDTDRSVRCAFTFLGDTYCELSMTEAMPSDLEERARAVRAKLSEREVFLSELPREEAAIATLQRVSHRFEVKSSEDATQFLVALKGGEDRGAGEKALMN